MELLALREALRQHPGEDLYLLTDNQYAMYCLTVWPKRLWLANGWRNSRGKPVENRDLIEPTLPLLEGRRLLIVEWVRGHRGHPLNERADKLANAAARRGR